MPKITFIQHDGSAQILTADENYSLMEIATSNQIEGIDGACGGVIACGTCHCYIPDEWTNKVIAEDNDITEEELDMLDVVTHRAQNSRLACQIKITNTLDGLIVKLPPK